MNSLTSPRVILNILICSGFSSLSGGRSCSFFLACSSSNCLFQASYDLCIKIINTLWYTEMTMTSTEAITTKYLR